MHAGPRLGAPAGVRVILATLCCVSAAAVGQPVVPETLETLPCGPYAMAIACKLLGRELRNEALSLIERPDGSSSMSDMARVAEANGLFAYAVKLSPSQLMRYDGVAVLQLVTRAALNDPWREHFTVYAGPGRTADTLIVIDPVARLGRGEVPAKSVIPKWTGATLLLSREPLDLDTIAFRDVSWTTKLGALLIGSGGMWGCTLLFARVRRRKAL